MSSKSTSLPFDLAKAEEIVAEFPTPVHVYDEAGIRQGIRRLQEAFSWCPGFKNYYAVKAAPNPYLLEILKSEGCGGDCSSLAELELCAAVGIKGEDIMFTSNDTPAKDYARAKQLGAVLNLDDITHIDYVDQSIGLPELVCFRYNPGPLREGNVIIGKPEDAKYGLTREQLFDAFRQVKERGVKRFGLHTMVASNERNAEFFVETARMLFELAVEIKEKCEVELEMVNLGGGIGIPYQPDQAPVDLARIGRGVKEAYETLIVPAGLHPLKVLMENGRMVTGPHGYLLTRAIHEKHIYKDYVGVDACMANLMRPGMYDAYHHITVLGKEAAAADTKVDVVGSLCENNDKFAVDRQLPKIDIGDLLVIHDAGAHGHAMGFQYNGKLRSAELLLQADGKVKQIRRAETLKDYFNTLDYPGLSG